MSNKPLKPPRQSPASDSHATNPIHTLFKDQLNQMLRRIATEKSLPSPDKALPYWYLENLVSLTLDEIEDAITEGSNDLGIDAIVISTDGQLVTFYQFKNLANLNRNVAGGDIDKLISGLQLILNKRHKKLANQQLKDKIDEVHQSLRRNYRICVVSTALGLPSDAKYKLDGLCETWATPGARLLEYECVSLDELQKRYYSKTLPTLDSKIEFSTSESPYAVKVGDHESYTFHVACGEVAELYLVHGEAILQQNIRTFEGDYAPTNTAIYRSCTGDKARNFFHYNNGITILCDACSYDRFQRKLELTRPQVVNGGQTLRTLASAKNQQKLDSNSSVIVRVITTDGDREFAGNVAVNLNNQTVVKGAFLKSNHPAIIQLGSTLEAKGFWLERREGEFATLSSSEKVALSSRINAPLDSHVIALQPACQAYVAFWKQNIDVAKKSPKKIFLSSDAGGYFEQFAAPDLTADRFLLSWELYTEGQSLIRRVSKLRQQRQTTRRPGVLYANSFPGYSFSGSSVFAQIEAAAPQSVLFLLAVLGTKYASLEISELSHKLPDMKNEVAFSLFDLAATKDRGKRAWATVLRSQQFFDSYTAKEKSRRSKRR